MAQKNPANAGEESIKMNPQDEAAAMARDTQVDAEPADEGVGAMTDNKGETPATENWGPRADKGALLSLIHI